MSSLQLFRAHTSWEIIRSHVYHHQPLSSLHLKTQTGMKGGHFSAIFPQSKISNRGLTMVEAPAEEWRDCFYIRVWDQGWEGGHIAQVPKIQPAAINTSQGEGRRATFRGISTPSSPTVAVSAQNGRTVQGTGGVTMMIPLRVAKMGCHALKSGELFLYTSVWQ